MSTSNEHSKKQGRLKRKARKQTVIERGKENFDEFGILRSDDQSRSSDSVPFEDPSFDITDGDISARRDLSGKEKFDLNLNTTDDDLTLDLTEASVDLSKTSDLHSKESLRSKSAMSQNQDETESLTEFEEIERLIQANTAGDSDDGLSDIPDDFELILSGRKSRESTRSRVSATSSKSSSSKSSSSSRHSKSSKSSHRSNSSRRSSNPLSSVDHLNRRIPPQEEEEDLNIVPQPRDTEQREDAPPYSPRVGAVPESMDVLKSQPLRSDTGYVSEDSNMLPNTPSVVASARQHSIPDSNDNNDNVSIHSALNFIQENDDSNQNEATLDNEESQQNSTDSIENQFSDVQPLSNMDEINLIGTLNESDLDMNSSVEHFLVPTRRYHNQPNSMVATFGTTEDFEALLKKQLEDMENDEQNGEPDFLTRSNELNEESLSTAEFNEPIRNPDNDHMTSTRRKKLPNMASTSMPRPGKNKLRLSPNQTSTSQTKESQKPQSSRTGPRTTRSPAANRAKKASNISNGRKSKSSLTRQSSDDMSIQSDASRSELRHRLRQETKERKRDEEFMTELRNNYDALLTKFAAAENTIDHLRVGARINLFASVPRGSPEEENPDFEQAQIKPGNHQHNNQNPQHSMGGAHQAPYTPSSPPDPLVANSFQLPAAAAAEFLKVALQLQAKDLQNKIDSFQTLLREAELSPEEKEKVMGNIKDSLRSLEKDYLAAVDDYAMERKQMCIATGGAVDMGPGFDPSGEIEGDIFRFGNAVRSLRETMNKPQQSCVRVSDSSPETDIDQKFNRLLEKYDQSIPDATNEANTTEQSLNYLSSDHEDEQSTLTKLPINNEFVDGNVEHGESTIVPTTIPNRYFEPAPSSLDTTRTTQAETPSNLTPSPSSRRNNNSFSSVGDSLPSKSPSPTRRPQSRLPRPINKQGRGRRDTSSSSPRGRKSAKPDKGTDSGFVGSESSRQSAATTPLENSKIKLVPRATPAVSVTRATEIKPPKAAPRRDRSMSPESRSTQKSSTRYRLNQQPNNHIAVSHQPTSTTPTYIDRVGIYKPAYQMDTGDDDMSTTSTVREMLNPVSRSPSTSPSRPPSTVIKHRGTLYPQHHGSKSGASVKSRSSSKRSVGSSTRDSTLDVIRGEISRLRDEIKSSKSQEKTPPIYSSTPRSATVGTRTVDLQPSDNETLKSIKNDIQALKHEVERQGRQKERDNTSVKSADVTTSRTGRSHQPRSYRARRSQSLGRDDLSERSSPDTHRRAGRSKSKDRGNWREGYWTYVAPPPLFSPVIGRTYHREHVQPQIITQQPPIYASTPVYAAPAPVVHQAPPSPTISYYAPRVSQQARVYVPTSPAAPRVYTTPSKPKASIYISPKGSRGSSPGVRKASVYIVDDGEEEIPLRRSHLTSSLRRSSSMSGLPRSPLVALPDSRLNDSIEMAERASERMRSRSRKLYKTLRDDVYKAQLLADTM